MGVTINNKIGIITLEESTLLSDIFEADRTEAFKDISYFVENTLQNGNKGIKNTSVEELLLRWFNLFFDAWLKLPEAHKVVLTRDSNIIAVYKLERSAEFGESFKEIEDDKIKTIYTID